MEYGASARFEMEDLEDLVRPATKTHSCTEGGTVFSAGSAMTSVVACEQCFCLRGERHCVRPRCLPAPPFCRARPSPGACCPTRYYCDHNATTTTSASSRQHECKVDAEWVKEGERVLSAEQKDGNCTRCFCLHGSVHCQPMACAPPLLGCQPVVRAGECCPHQYHCQHNKFETLLTSFLHYLTENTFSSTKKDVPSENSSTTEHSVQNITENVSEPKNRTKPHINSTPNEIPITSKVKRKTDELESTTRLASLLSTEINSSIPINKIVGITTPTTKLSTTTQTTTHEAEKTTEQPEKTIKVTVNSTINCTTELSTSLPLNITIKNISALSIQTEPHTPIQYNKQFEEHSFDPEDIITDRTVSSGFDDNDTFTVNVSSSLNHDNNKSSPGHVTALVTGFQDSQANVENSSRIKNEEDYDYNEPTLPPSLPNLKIIPFVAADAVVEDSSKVIYTPIKRKDELPVYYPTISSEDSLFTTKEDAVYSATPFPIYSPNPNNLRHEIKTTVDKDQDLTGEFPEFTVSTSLGSHLINKVKLATNTPPTSSSTLGFKTPAVNLFSPPVETEGGFVPKGPGIIGEYYAVYPSTPPASAPNLTTSMLLDTTKEGGCITKAGIYVAEGETIPVSCTSCTCAWGELQCVPRVCYRLPSNCIRKKPAKTSSVPESSLEANSEEVCCGEIICNTEKIKQTPNNITTNVTIRASTIKPTDDKINNTMDTRLSISNNNAHLNQTHTIKQNNITVNLTDLNVTNFTSVTQNKTSNEISNVKTDANSKINITTGFDSTTQSIIRSSTEKDDIVNETQYISQEYEDIEDEDEGFSLGNVLKLLLSDNYEATTAATRRKSTVDFTTPITTRRTTSPPITRKPMPSFVPLPQYSYTPPKKTFVPNTVNRIDHLVLGEATAIKKRPPYTIAPHYTMAPFQTTSVSPFRPLVMTDKPKTNDLNLKPMKVPSVVTQNEDTSATPLKVSGVTPGPGLGPGLLKLDGCNIYGRMYRVGRIIAELSTPCQECRCTEFGVQCKPLKC